MINTMIIKGIFGILMTLNSYGVSQGEEKTIEVVVDNVEPMTQTIDDVTVATVEGAVALSEEKVEVTTSANNNDETSKALSVKSTEVKSSPVTVQTSTIKESVVASEEIVEDIITEDVEIEGKTPKTPVDSVETVEEADFENNNVGNNQPYDYIITEIVGDEIHGIPTYPEASAGNKGIFLYKDEVPFDVELGTEIEVVWGEEEDIFKSIEKIK